MKTTCRLFYYIYQKFMTQQNIHFLLNIQIQHLRANIFNMMNTYTILCIEWYKYYHIVYITLYYTLLLCTPTGLEFYTEFFTSSAKRLLLADWLMTKREGRGWCNCWTWSDQSRHKSVQLHEKHQRFFFKKPLKKACESL